MLIESIINPLGRGTHAYTVSGVDARSSRINTLSQETERSAGHTALRLPRGTFRTQLTQPGVPT